MTGGEIALIVVAAAFVAGVIVWRVGLRLRGKGGCDCGCSDCAGCKSCASKKKK